MQHNHVFINSKGIIEVIMVGELNSAAVAQIASEIAMLAKKQRAAGKPVIVLDNLLQMGEVHPDARIHVVEHIRSIDHDKFAMLGKDIVLRLGANLILQATGRGDKVRYFEDRAACEEWLLEDASNT